MIQTSDEPVSLAAFRPYLPAVASQPALSQGEPVTRDAVTMFLDIAGFTGLSERLARHGTAGTEQLSGVIRRVIGGALDIVVGHGGDALAFGGDATTVAFPARAGAWDAAGRAASEVIELVESATGTPTLAGPLDITVRVGISGGRVASFVCAAEARHVVVHLGPGLDRAVAAAAGAGRNGIAIDRAHLHSVPAHRPGQLPDWAPTVLHPVTASRVAAGGGPPDEHRLATKVFLSLPAIDDREAESVGELASFVCEATDIVTDLGGDVLQCTGGDKGIVLFATFGAPVAHPDDALRALHWIDRLRAAGTLTFAAGVSTGLAFTAAFGGRSRRFTSALGDSTNLAARLMAAAGQGSTIIDAATATAAGRRIRLGEPRTISVKNRDQPADVVELLSLAVPQHEFHVDGVSPLVGREPELAAVEAMLDRAASGGEVLQLIGEAGTGKTRLVGEIMRRAEVRGMTVRFSRFEAFGAGRPLDPFARLLRHRPGTRPITSSGELAAAIAAVRPGDQALAPLLGQLLDLDAVDTAATAGLSAEERAQLGRRLIVDLLCATAVPALAVIEDVHWADEASLHVLNDLEPALAGSQLSLVTTGRPGRAFSGGSVLKLVDLQPEQLATVVRDTWGRLGGGELPADYVNTLVERATGSPLFAQTVTEIVRRGYRPGLPLPEVPLPDELLPFLISRIDALGDSAQATALRAAVLGRPASSGELARVFSCSAAETGDDLALLADAGVMRWTGDRGEPTAWLRHATVAEAVLGRASHADRAPLHERVCHHLIETGGSAREVAAQLEYCDLPELELHWYRKARGESSAAWGLVEAQHWAELALSAAGETEALPDTVALAELEQQLGRYDQAAERLAGVQGAEAERLLGRIAFETGRPADAVVHLERAQHDGASGPAVTWPLTMALCDLGRFGDGRTLALGQLEAAGAHDPRLRLDALANLGVVEFREGDLDAAAAVLEDARALALELGDLLRLAHVTGDLAGARFLTGQFSEAAALLDEASALAERLGARRLVTMVLGNITYLRLKGGDYDGAARAAVAGADAALGIGDIAVALDCMQVPIDVAELAADNGRAVDWWRRHAELEDRLGRPDVSAISWFRYTAIAAARGKVAEAQTAFQHAEAAAAGLQTDDLELHRARAKEALAGRYTPPPEAEPHPISLPRLDAGLPAATPEIVDDLLGRIAARLSEQSHPHD